MQNMISYRKGGYKSMKKALVIGAGPAGLTAAYELLTKSKDIEVTIKGTGWIWAVTASFPRFLK